MSHGLDERSGSGDRSRSGLGKASERFYMNKAFGRSLEMARALDAQKDGKQGTGEFQRATIERDPLGGHKVVIERQTTVERGARTGQDVERSEHSFAKPEDAIQFLHNILQEQPGGGSGTGKRGNMGVRADAEELGKDAQDGGEKDDLLGGLLSDGGR